MGTTLTPCLFYFVDDPTYPGFTDGSTWNGFNNVWVTPAVRDRIVADIMAAEGDPGECLDDLKATAPDADGLISLANGWATQVAPVVDSSLVQIVTAEGHTCCVCTFAELLAENADGIDSEEAEEIRETLSRGRAYHGGGGAAAEFTITLSIDNL